MLTNACITVLTASKRTWPSTPAFCKGLSSVSVIVSPCSPVLLSFVARVHILSPSSPPVSVTNSTKQGAVLRLLCERSLQRGRVGQGSRREVGPSQHALGSVFPARTAQD